MSQNLADKQQSSPENGASSSSQHKERPTLPPIRASAEGTQNGLRRNSSGSIMSPGPNSATSNNADSQSRSLRMHSILNPPSSQDDQRGGQQRIPGAPLPRSVPDGASTPSSSQTTPNRTLPPMPSLPSLGPVSQKVEASNFPHRSLPPGTISLPTPSTDARKSPLPSATGTPQMGTPPVNNRPGYPFPHQQQFPDAGRRGSDAMVTAPASQSNSPTTSYSSYGHTARNSPTPHFSHPQPHPYYGGQIPHNPMPNGLHSGPQITLGADSAFRVGSGPGGQGTYQLMTLDTDQGPIQVPVDVQAASKMADEKRKRNAGASARFRQRRKEKEKEATQTISRLETKLRQVGEEKEYYRMERDYFRGLVYNSPAQVHVTPRLPSPKQRQLSDGSSNGTAEWQQSGERGSEDGRNQRRRISGYVDGPNAATPTPGQNAPPPQPPPPAQQFGSTPYQYPPHDARQQQPPQPHQPGRPPMAGPLPPQTNPYNHPQVQHGPPPPPPPQAYDRAWKPQ